MSIINTALTTTAANIYVSSGNSATTVIHFCNYTNNGATANVWVVPAGLSANSSTIIYSNVALTAQNTLVVDTEKLILSNGDTIQANVSVNGSVTATVSYIGI
jgi:hypothetical protein